MLQMVWRSDQLGSALCELGPGSVSFWVLQGILGSGKTYLSVLINTTKIQLRNVTATGRRFFFIKVRQAA